MDDSDGKDLVAIQDLESVAQTPGLEVSDKHHGGHIADMVAADYIDPTLHISREENERLRRKIYRK